MRGPGRVLFLSSDVEQDAPPYLNGYRGIDEGLPLLLDLLDELNVKATFFVVAMVAERRPRAVASIVDRGHELGSHGYSHRRLDRMPTAEAKEEVVKSIKTLSEFAEVKAFRAPNLKLPRPLLQALRDLNVGVDSSVALYKPPFVASPRVDEGVTRLPVTVTSSVLRAPFQLQRPLHQLVGNYVGLFVHPWEFVKVRHWRPDIWLGTGPGLVSRLREVIEFYLDRGYRALTASEAATLVTQGGAREA